MPYTFTVKNGDKLEERKIPFDKNVRLFRTYRDMLMDVGGDDNLEADDSLELKLISNDYHIHENVYPLIIDLCNHLTDNEDKYLLSEKTVLDSEGNPEKDSNGNEKKTQVKDNGGWKQYMNSTMCVKKDKPDLSLSAFLKSLFAKYCNVDDKEEYKYLYEGVLSVVNFTNCDNEVECDKESYVLHILCSDYADSILDNRNF